MEAAITHCTKGHEFTKENTIVRSNGTRKCRECAKDYAKRFRASKDREYFRNNNLRAFYKLKPEQYEELLARQSGKCANPYCSEKSTAENPLHVDHDHSCCSGRQTCGKCIRGLLCSMCNLVLGRVADDPQILAGLIQYLSWKK